MGYLEVSAHMTVRPGCLEGFKDYAHGHFMTVYGEPSQVLLDLLKAHAAGHTWFTFLQGLEPSPAVPSPMPGADEARQLV